MKNKFQVLADKPADNINALCENTQKILLATSKKHFATGEEKPLDNSLKTEQQSTLCSQAMKKRSKQLQKHTGRNQGCEEECQERQEKLHNVLAQEEQSAAERGDIRTVYKITKTRTGGLANKVTVVEDKNGKVPAKDKDQFNRWAEHLNHTLKSVRHITRSCHKECRHLARIETRTHHQTRNTRSHQTDKRKQGTS